MELTTDLEIGAGNHITVVTPTCGHAIDISEPPVPRGPSGIDSAGFIVEGNAFWLAAGLGAINAEQTISGSLFRGNTIIASASGLPGDAAITLGGASTHNIIDGNAIRNFGVGISMHQDCSNNTVVNNQFTNVTVPMAEV